MTKPTFAIISHQVRATAAWVLCIALLSSCAIPTRDPAFEKHAFAVSKSLNSFFVTNKYKQKKIPYSAVVKDYNDIEASLDTMVLMARLANEKTATKAEEIRERFRGARILHQEKGFLTPSMLETKHKAYEGLFHSLISAERAKPEDTDS